jgi:ankyrin repeat domain-containing protein 17
MHVLKNTIKNNSNTMNQIGTFHTTTTPSTFAAKLSSTVDINAKKSSFTGHSPSLSGPSNSIPISPIKHHTSGNQSGLPAPFTSGISANSTSQQTAVIGTSTKPPFSQNSPQSDNSSNNNLVNNIANTRSITPIGPPKSINRNVAASPLLLQSVQSNCSVNSSTAMTSSSSISLAATSIIQPPVTGLASQLQSKINQLQHGNAQAHEYSLFNDSYSNQWEAKQYSSNNSKQFMENVPPLQVDASKAPGYRGTAVSSPVSSKTPNSATTPPSQSHQSNSVVPSIVSNSISGSSLSNTTINTPNSIHGEIGKPNNQQSQILQSQSGSVNTSGLAVQRPVMSSSSNQIRQVDKYSISANSAHTPNIRQNLFETPTNTAQNLAPQMMNYGHQADQIQQMFHPNIQANPLHMSRLNPRASSFSSMHQQGGIQSQSKTLGSNILPSQQHPNQNYGGMFHQNGINNFQKMTTVPYNAAPGPVRNQAQLGNNRWFSELGHLVNQREMMGLENGLTKNLGGSPAMSPNNSQGIISGIPNQPPPMQDDGRKPRPIGTERNWKLGYIGTNMEDPAPPSWMMDKQQQQQIAPNWMPPPHAPIGPPRNHFIEDMQPPPTIPQDHFPPWQMEYLNPPHLGPNQSNVNLMQSLQYATFPAPIELGAPLPDKIEQWVEPEKQGWSAKWTF